MTWKAQHRQMMMDGLHSCAGVYVAYAIVAWCYFTVSIAGYWAFGNTLQVGPLTDVLD